jgi:hypothetical protein
MPSFCGHCGHPVSTPFCPSCGSPAASATAGPDSADAVPVEAPSAAPVTVPVGAQAASAFGSALPPVAPRQAEEPSSPPGPRTINGLAALGSRAPQALVGVAGAVWSRPPAAAVVVAVAVFGLFAIGKVGLPLPGGPDHVLAGEFVVKDLGNLDLDALNAALDGASTDCGSGLGGGYSDLRAGTAVSVKDGEGRLLGTGALKGGRQSINGCSFAFSVEVPDSAFYEVEVSQRGSVPFSREELDRQDWRVSLSVGDFG